METIAFKRLIKVSVTTAIILGAYSAPLKAKGIYKCVDNENKTYFNDKPCPANNEETEFQAVKDPVGGYIPPNFVPELELEGNKNIVVGKSKSNILKSNDQSISDDETSFGNDQPQNNLSKLENSSSDEDIVSNKNDQALSDKAFNAELKKQSKGSSNNNNVLKNVYILEPSS